MKRNTKLLLAGVIILIGGMLMRFAWFIINQQLSTAIIITGSVLFLGGVVYIVNILFKK